MKWKGWKIELWNSIEFLLLITAVTNTRENHWCLEKGICQPLTGQDISHAKGKFRHLKNWKLVDHSIHNERSAAVEILIG